jgi:hypothetical protein
VEGFFESADPSEISQRLRAEFYVTPFEVHVG